MHVCLGFAHYYEARVLEIMEKEKSDEAFSRTFDDPSFPFVSIGIMNASCAGPACVKHSTGVFRHEAPVNVRVAGMNPFRYTSKRTLQKGCVLVRG